MEEKQNVNQEENNEQGSYILRLKETGIHGFMSAVIVTARLIGMIPNAGIVKRG